MLVAISGPQVARNSDALLSDNVAFLLEVEKRDKETADALESLARTVIAQVIGGHFTPPGATYLLPSLSATAIVSIKKRDIRRGLVAGAIAGGVAIIDTYLGSVPALLIGLGSVALQTEYANRDFFRRWFRLALLPNSE
jgi:hypothetical protein